MKMKRFISVALFAATCSAVLAQGSVTVDQLNRASQQRQNQQQRQREQVYMTPAQEIDREYFGSFFVEYMPCTMHMSAGGYTHNESYNGIGVGFSYAMPITGPLFFDAGLKGQFFWKNQKEGGVEYKNNMFSATVPVDLVYDWIVSEGFAVDPYVGLYGRLNISATTKAEGGGYSQTLNLFDKDDMDGNVTMKRFQFGWQAGVNFRISEVLTVGGGYWMDFNEIDEHTKMRGFNIRLGANF